MRTEATGDANRRGSERDAVAGEGTLYISVYMSG